MKTFRDVFEENYMPVEEPRSNKRGFKIRYEYVGEWYVWAEDERVVRTSKHLIGVCAVVCVLTYFCAALQDTALNYSRYVSLTASLSLAALLFELIGVVQFYISKEKITNMDFQGMRWRILISTFIHAFLLFCTAALCVYQTAVSGISVPGVLAAAGYFISGLSSTAIFCIYRSLAYKKQKNENFSRYAAKKRF